MATQDNRFASVTTPLGKDKLLFNRMRGHEEMGRLFEYNLDLLVEKINLDSIVTDKILGQAMTVALSLPNGKKRYFDGLVTQFRHHGAQDDFFVYQATLRPWLWFLTRTSNCRIYQDLSVPDIVKKVFETNGFSDFKLELTGSYTARNYCVQYRETDFDFVSRLMEYEGIFYFFTHEEHKHTLVIADSVSAYQNIADYEAIPYFPPENKGQRKRDHIFEWQTACQVHSGTYSLHDYDFEKPNTSLLTKFTERKSHAHAEGERYDYPGNYSESSVGDAYSNIRLDELQTDYQVIEGKGNAMGLTTGMLFTLEDHYITAENSKYIVFWADFFFESNEYRSTNSTDTQYECNFKAIRSTQQFRPRRLTPVPFVQGPQTATVAGKEGEEIWTDKYGRIKVQFHWERDGNNNETSSCWVRVASPVAGKKWGWYSLPRIGQEVVVSFLEGNPDRPLITGSVYNAMQMPPYTLPDNQTRSGIKSSSSKAGTADNFNEIRFEDKKDSEEVYIHAEKDFNCEIENNESRKIGITKKDKGDQTIEIQNDRTVSLNEGNDTLTVKMGNREANINTGNDTLTVKKGNRLTNIDTGNDTLTVKMGNRETNVNMGNDTLNVKQGNYVVNVDAGKATITALTSIELKVGGNSIKIEQSGITIKGTMVKVQADATLDVKSPMTTVNGDGMLTLKGGITMIN